MPTSDAVFAGSIPEIYERCLVPLLFAPFAADLASRAAALEPRPRQILETAAGTGIVTRAIAERLPDAVVIATDLNPDMLAVAERELTTTNAACRQADAQALPFEGSCFDLLVCQFGVMFYPDRPMAYREARRALCPGGHFLFNVWAGLDSNPASKIVHDTVAALFPEDPPQFLARTPFGYADPALIEQELADAGFTEVTIEPLQLANGRVPPEDVADGLCRGSPLASEIARHGDAAADRSVAAVVDALQPITAHDGRIDAQMKAYVVTATA
jgi:ubiquinone/menaquinone biosynthesis C-methylase UbiE